jgi:uncharacterized integral membrane protein
METPEREFERTWQPRLWLSLAALIMIVAYLIAFVIGNSEEASVNFVFATATTSLIWVILLSLLAGLFGGVLLSQLHRRRRALTGRPEAAPDPEPARESEADPATDSDR